MAKHFSKYRRRPPLTAARVLAWAGAHCGRTGAWPVAASGQIVGHPRETWAAVEKALRRGFRGLPGGDSLARLLRRHRAPPSAAAAPPTLAGCARRPGCGRRA